MSNAKWWTPRLMRAWSRRGPSPHRSGAATRRAFLGGAAAVITLPFLESLRPAGQAWANGGPPVRLVWVYVPNGMVMNHFTPTQDGPGYALPRILEPLAGVADQVSVLTGLANRAAQVPVAGDHARGTGSFLTCQTVTHTSDASQIQNGISVDQVAANAIGHQTLFPSLELGTSGGAPVGDCDSGYSCAYTRNISWSGPSTPMAKMTDPKLVFDRLFSGFDLSLTEEDRERRARWRASVLDTVTGEANDLHARLSTSDKAKLDEYLTGVRELEKRLQSGFTGECAAPDAPELGLPYPAAVDAMNEIMVKALECDLTRIVTFMMENAGSNRSFDFLGVPNAHHELSHHQNVAATLEALTVIDTWEVSRFADLVQRMGQVVEADGSTLLDNSLVVFSSEISDGDWHNHDNLPVLLAGSGGGHAVPGRHIRYASERPIANLFLSMLHAVGVNEASFGQDGTAPLDLT